MRRRTRRNKVEDNETRDRGPGDIRWSTRRHETEDTYDGGQGDTRRWTQRH